MASDTLAAALLESDRRYFELGACTEPIGGAMLAWVPGMERAPAACVVQRVGDAGGAFRGPPRRWLSTVGQRLEAMGCTAARIYLDAPAPALEAALADAGFRPRIETGYVWCGEAPPGRPDVTLRPVQTAADWAVKAALHAGSERAADGHVLSGAAWVELERAKCRSGEMQAYLVEVAGEVCGAIAAIPVDGLLRAKNVFVHPSRRRQRIGAAAMGRMISLAASQGFEATGIFGVEGKPGNALYRFLGLSPVCERIEWSRPLDGPR